MTWVLKNPERGTERDDFDGREHAEEVRDEQLALGAEVELYWRSDEEEDDSDDGVAAAVELDGAEIIEMADYSEGRQ